MKKSVVLGLTLLASISCFAQQAYYGVSPGDGYGLRFWNSDSYKIHMGNSGEYHYGPVSGYSIKHNMSSDAGRGWTWGLGGTTPVAGLSNTGHMQIAGDFVTKSLLRVSNGYGAVDIGPMNGSWSHFGTDRPKFYFNKPVTVDGGISSYSSNNLFLQTADVTRITILNSNGNVGIGTATPSAKLEVVGPSTGNGVSLSVGGGGDMLINSGGSIFFDGNYSYASGNYIRPIENNTQSFVTAGIERLKISASGDIGIGTSSPDSKLTVKGTIHTQEVKVDLDGSVAPDYVFEKDYPLTSLEELKSYIDQNKHLPEVPSAKEMEETGINLKEMNLLLLKKVEELTLHLIELKKEKTYEVELLQSQIDQLKRK
ncbi:MAG TPA: tail fiber protein [Cyclobacteriaceae bacterium]|nr:tail fiber protein [Cyclobacteriaceae bacterium]